MSPPSPDWIVTWVACPVQGFYGNCARSRFLRNDVGFVQRRQGPRSVEPEPEHAAATAPVNPPAKTNWNLDADKPRTNSMFTEEKHPRLSPKERVAQIEFIRSLNK